MQRRRFIQSTLATGASLTAATPSLLANAAKKKQEYYELRIYTFKNDVQQGLVDQYYKEAAIPALNRLGCQPIGVFTELKPEQLTKLYVVIPFPSMENFSELDAKLAKDTAYQQAAADYLRAPAEAPAYERIQSSLLKAFSGMPQLAGTDTSKERIFELRRYESCSESAGKKKIEMFNTAEISVFKRTGLTPVFFGEALIGEARPNLTYMITFPNMEAHDSNWKIFGSDPEWKKISSIPEYADKKIVSKITKTFLKPTTYSQL